MNPDAMEVKFNMDHLKNIKFGKDMLKEFPNDPTVVSINHGSFGNAPNIIIEGQIQHIKNMNSNPCYQYEFINYH